LVRVKEYKNPNLYTRAREAQMQNSVENMKSYRYGGKFFAYHLVASNGQGRS